MHPLSLIACKALWVFFFFFFGNGVNLRETKGRKIVLKQLDTSLSLQQSKQTLNTEGQDNNEFYSSALVLNDVADASLLYNRFRTKSSTLSFFTVLPLISKMGFYQKCC